MSSASELRNSNVASCVADTSLATLTNLNALVHLTRDQVVATFDFEDVHLKPVMIDTALLTFLSGTGLLGLLHILYAIALTKYMARAIYCAGGGSCLHSHVRAAPI